MYSGILGIKCKKKIGYKLTSNKQAKKDIDIQADTLGIKKMRKWFMNYYYLSVKVNKYNFR